jgi:uncharacterized membrane protein YgdD (TMEM256/DUF423 family)
MAWRGMLSPSTLAFKAGALSGALAVAFGAFGSHALQRYVTDPKLQKTWETAAHYHLVHSVALIACSAHRSSVPAALMGGGIVLFSGSLYALVLTGQKWLGAVTPIGGMLLIGGWATLGLL